MENQQDKAQAPETKSTTTELLEKSAAIKKKNHETIDKLNELKAQSDALLKKDNPDTPET